MIFIIKYMDFEKQNEVVRFPDIALEIQRMAAEDQKMREQSEKDDSWDDVVDVKNSSRMKEIVGEIGWPTIAKVGSDAAYKAWLLVQHADHDVDFQNECLQLMKEAPVQDVERVNIAYLEDRVCVNQGRGQLYGTQFTQENGQHVPRQIEDEINVDNRRVELGLGPLTEQIELMYKKYPLPDKS